MRAVWVDTGNDPDHEKLARHGVTSPYFSLLDPRVTPAYLQSQLDRGYTSVGVYAAWNWGPFGGDGRHGGPGDQFAELVSQKLKQVMGASLRNGFPKVQLNQEDHDPAKITAMLTRWRALHRYQDTSWTLEGMQGGWMDPGFVQTVVNARVRVVPQAYNGPMTQAWDTLVCARDLTKRGIPDSVISPFYDAARLPVHWDGFAFTQGRLP